MINSIPFPDTPFKVNEVFQTERGIFVGSLTTRKIAHGVPVFGLSCSSSDYIPLLKQALNSQGETQMTTRKSPDCTILETEMFTNQNPYSFIVDKTARGLEVHFPYESTAVHFNKDCEDYDNGEVRTELSFLTLKEEGNFRSGSLIKDLTDAGFEQAKSNPYLFFYRKNKGNAEDKYLWLKELIKFHYNESLDRFPKLLHPEETQVSQAPVAVKINEGAIAQKVVEAILSSDRFMDVLAERIAAKLPQGKDYTKSLFAITQMQEEILNVIESLNVPKQEEKKEHYEDEAVDEEQEEDEYEGETPSVRFQIPIQNHYQTTLSDEDLANDL